MTRRRGGGAVEAGLLGGAVAALLGVALLVPLPWSLLVGTALVVLELAFYRRLRAERGEA